MTATVYDFPPEWYQFIVSQKFKLRAINQAAVLPWGGAGASISGPHTQAWVTEITFAQLSDNMAPALGPIMQDMDAFFARLRGRSGVVRMSWARVPAPWYDRNRVGTTSVFTDGSDFTDGTGFGNGYLPPEVFVLDAAAKGARYLTLGGFPASLASCLRRGDLLQIRPNGIAGEVPHLYHAMYGGDTNSDGEIGIAIEPGLREGVAAGDVVNLRYPSTLFRMVDDSQFDLQVGEAGIGSLGGSLVEALDLVP